MENPLLTTDEVAAFFKVSPRTIRRWVKEKRLKAHKINRRDLRFDRADVLAFYEQIKQGEQES